MKAPKSIDSRAAIRRHVAGPCQSAARLVIEELGALNIQETAFDDIFGRVYADHGDEDQVNALVRSLLAEPAVKTTALELESRLTSALIKRTEAGYMLGLAVGRLLAGGEKAGAR